MELITKNLSVTIENKSILKNINLSIKENQLIALFGPNGCGKTTLLKTISGINKNFSGEVNVIENSNILKNNSVCYISANFNSVFSYSVIDFVLMGIASEKNIFYKPKQKDKTVAEEILSKLNIIHLKDKFYNDLSTGEKQLTLIAKGLIQNTQIICFDEPVSNLDFNNQHLILKIISDLSQNGKTIIVSLHDPNLALKYFKNILFMQKGTILKDEIGINDRYKIYENNLKTIYGKEILFSKTSFGTFVTME